MGTFATGCYAPQRARTRTRQLRLSGCRPGRHRLHPPPFPL